MFALEIVATVLGSLGGAAIIVAALVKWLGQVWADRIAKQTVAKFEQELETTKARNALALEEFKRRSEADLKDREQFGGISSKVYQNFFENRISTYLRLLEIKNDYISQMHEDAVTEETERLGDAYYNCYIKLRKVMVEKQLYVSNELEKAFHDLRLEAARYIKEADLAEAYALGVGAHPLDADEQRSPVHDKLATETQALMSAVIRQIDTDVSKLRARIELDRV